MTPVKDKRQENGLYSFIIRMLLGKTKKLPNAVFLVKKKLKNGI